MNKNRSVIDKSLEQIKGYKQCAVNSVESRKKGQNQRITGICRKKDFGRF